jgi:hypothetical protein
MAITMPRCEPCNLFFADRLAFLSHMQNSKQHAHCYRCDKSCLTDYDLSQHVKNSNRHRVCEYCPLDFCDAQNREEHERVAHHACPDCRFSMPSEMDRIEHDVLVHNMCQICSRFFESPNNLQQVRGFASISSFGECRGG